MVEKSHTAGSLPNLYEPLKNLGQKLSDWFAPASEASVSQETYDIVMELPGVKDEDIDVSVHDGNLVVRGEKRAHHEESTRTYFFSEREYGAFQRTFRLPPDADQAAINATYDDGILTVRIGKRSVAQGDHKKIEVRRK